MTRLARRERDAKPSRSGENPVTPGRGATVGRWTSTNASRTTPRTSPHRTSPGSPRCRRRRTARSARARCSPAPSRDGSSSCSCGRLGRNGCSRSARSAATRRSRWQRASRPMGTSTRSSSIRSAPPSRSPTSIAARWAGQITIHIGPAGDSIAALPGSFDFVFMDADKTGYIDYYEAVLPRLTERGLIVADNTLHGGRVFDDGDPIADFNAHVAADPRSVPGAVDGAGRHDRDSPRLTPTVGSASSPCITGSREPESLDRCRSRSYDAASPPRPRGGLRDPGCADGRERVHPARSQRARGHAQGRLEGPGGRLVHGARQEVERPRLGRGERDRAVGRQPPGRLQARLLGRLGHVQEGRLEDRQELLRDLQRGRPSPGG